MSDAMHSNSFSEDGGSESKTGLSKKALTLVRPSGPLNIRASLAPPQSSKNFSSSSFSALKGKFFTKAVQLSL